VVQADGLCLKFTKQRISHDLFAEACDAHCDSFGPLLRPWASETLLVNGDYNQLPEVVASAKDQRCLAVFVVPVWPGAKWYATLRKYAVCVASVARLPNPFTISQSHRDHNSHPPSWGIHIIIADFRVLSEPRGPNVEPITHLNILSVFPDSGSTRLGPGPFLLTSLRKDPAAALDPVAAEPPGNDPLPASQGNSMIKRKPAVAVSWRLAPFLADLEAYPDPFSRFYTRQGLTEGYGIIQADRSRRVLASNMPSLAKSDEAAMLLREGAIDEVAAGKQLGPFPEEPFPNKWCDSQPRNQPGGAVPKDKWDAASTRLRPVTDCSAGGEQSLNALTNDPDLLILWMRALWLFDVIATLGPGCVVISLDVKSAYRQLPLRPENLHLFLKVIVTKKFGREIFVDLACPFGWVGSYYSWEVFAAILVWRLRMAGVPNPYAYVDNFYCFVAGRPDGSVDLKAVAAAKAAFCGVFSKYDLPMHEYQCSLDSPFVKILGWEVSPLKQIFRCTTPRLALTKRILAEWAQKTHCSLRELESVTGLFYFVSNAFKLGRPAMGAFHSMKRKFAGIRPRARVSKSAVQLPMSVELKAAVSFWCRVFASWSGSCPLIAPHGPRTPWNAIWRCDGSSKWGAGAWSTSPRQFITHKWSVQERSAAMRELAVSAPFFEALTILLAVRTWGPSASGKRILILTDCKSVELAINKGYSQTATLHPVIADILFASVTWSFDITVGHVARGQGVAADLLSRDLVPEALAEVAREDPSVVPASFSRGPPPSSKFDRFISNA
jgi:hypothetical protein